MAPEELLQVLPCLSKDDKRRLMKQMREEGTGGIGVQAPHASFPRHDSQRKW